MLQSSETGEPVCFPKNMCFASGPVAKYPGWVAPAGTYVGRSHRSEFGWSFINRVVDSIREVLQIPRDYYVAVIDGSTTSAMEALLWNLLGNRSVDVVNHCVFSNHWNRAVVEELKVSARTIFGDFPKMADVSQVDFRHDVVFCLSSTTSGVAFHDENWIPEDRMGLTIADAASGVFCMRLDWNKLDATAFSWQKGLGGEAGFGTVVLSPRAIDRLTNYQPNWPIPRAFRLTNNGKLNRAVFEGATINTPSMLCFEDYYSALCWAKKIGSLDALLKRVNENYSVVKRWTESQNVFSFLVEEKYRAHHIACFDIEDERYQKLSEADKWQFLKKIVAFCETRKVGYDFLGHIMTHPHLRVWCGPTVEASDIQKFLPWMAYAYDQLSSKL